MTDKNKKGFDLARNSIYVADPHELCIVGGKALPPGERGELDTELDEQHELFDERVDLPLTEEFVNNVDAYGVLVPITIAKLDDEGTPFVVFGRQRVRAARVVNKRREKAGEPLLKIECKVRRSSGRAGLLGAMIAENEARVADDVTTKIEKAKRLKDRGVDDEGIAVTFGVSLSTLQQWMAYDLHAIAAVKSAVEGGKLSQTAAATIARIKEPEKQAEALKETLAAGGGSVPGKSKKASSRAARTAAKKIKKPGSSGGVIDKATQRKLLVAVEKMNHARAGEKTLAWWDGVEAALRLVTGDGDVDERLASALKEVA